jgi:hypothetical protein
MSSHPLSQSDYESLKRSVKGWTARKLKSYGVPWPPQHGWRKALIKEYEHSHRPAWRVSTEAVDRWDSYREMVSMKKLYQEKSGDYSY